jgi:hypothetical protein
MSPDIVKCPLKKEKSPSIENHYVLMASVNAHQKKKSNWKISPKGKSKE